MSSVLTRLWSHALHALSRLRATLLPLDTLLNKERRALRASLSALECFCRRLALTQAILDRGSSLSAVARTAKDPSQTRKQAGPKTCGPRNERQPSLRLWPRAKRLSARITLLGPPASMREIWRNQRRDALIARLKRARLTSKPTHLRLADRIVALQRLLDAPRAALRRLARKLRLTPKIAHLIAARRAPQSTLLSSDAVHECESLCWNAILDTS